MADQKSSPGDPYNAVIEVRHQLNPLLAIFKVRPDSGEMMNFIPGQYTVLGLIGGESRSFNAQPEEISPPVDRVIQSTYTLCNTPEEKGLYEFYVMQIVGGALTPRLFDRQQGERLYLGNEARGDFTLDLVPSQRPVLMIATGTGLSPFISMLRSELGRGSKRRFVVVEGVRYSWNLGYRDELTRMAAQHENVSYIPTITRVELDPDWSGPVGRIRLLLDDDVVENATGIPVAPDQFDVLLCGNPGMIDEVTSFLVARGFSTEGREPGRIHAERYWEKAPAT